MNIILIVVYIVDCLITKLNICGEEEEKEYDD